jgi:transcriptional activator SPT8
MRDVDDGEGADDGDAEVDGDLEDGPNSPSNSSQGSEGDDRVGGQDQQEAPDQDEASASPQQGADESILIPKRPTVRPEALAATTYDIVPTIAAPQSTSINAVTATADMRWVFSGGSDGYIRKYNWVDSVNSRLMLTVAQRHPFVDSVVKAGVMMAYWENWDSSTRSTSTQGSENAPTLSPVYSLAVQNQGLWLLAGTDSGNIRLQSSRHDEGKEIALLQKHTSAVSVLTLSSDERSLLSGSWDKCVLDWDLDVGTVRTTFSSGSGQISSIEARPLSSIAVPEESGEPVMVNGTFTSNNHLNNSGPGAIANGIRSREQSRPPQDHSRAGTSPDSLFSDPGGDDFFGDSAGPATANGVVDPYDDDSDEFARAIADGPRPDDDPDAPMPDALDGLQPVQPPDGVAQTADAPSGGVFANGVTEAPPESLPNGLLHAEDTEMTSEIRDGDLPLQPEQTSDSTFMATSIDGTIRVWDRRQPNPVARMVPRNTPPWCMSACWSPDGNHIYAGRRNCIVEEFDLRAGLKSPQRIFKFPQGSGSVTSVKAMPNGRHLIWYAATEAVLFVLLIEIIVLLMIFCVCMICANHRLHDPLFRSSLFRGTGLASSLNSIWILLVGL